MLGTAVCSILIDQGHSVKALCLKGTETNTLRNIGVSICMGDILNYPLLVKEMESSEYVIHIAALTSTWPSRNNRVVEVNVNGCKNVMKAAKHWNYRRMVYVGSASSFQYGTLERPGTEKSPFKGWDQRLDYIDSKYYAQEMLLDAYKNEGFPALIINPTFMIGPYDSGPTSGTVLLNLYKGRVPGYSGGGKNFVYSLDVATAIVNALTMGRIGECYIAGNINLTYGEFFSKAANVMSKKMHLIKFPDWMIYTIGKINSTYALVSGRPPKLSYEVAKIATKYHGFSAAKAVKELHMPQTDIELAIEESVRWFKENSYLD